MVNIRACARAAAAAVLGRPTRVRVLGWALLVAGLPVQPAFAIGDFYTCSEKSGVRKSDHRFAECKGTQTVTHPNGGVDVLPTDEELAADEACQAKKKEAQAQNATIVRREQQLLKRFPDEAAHQRARDKEIEPIRTAILRVQNRLAELAKERKHLTDEAEFYVGKAMPPELRRELDRNDASVAAENDILRSQEAELARTNKRYDEELVDLRKLWSGGTTTRVPVPVCKDFKR